jgi:hypothetical protein
MKHWLQGIGLFTLVVMAWMISTPDALAQCRVRYGGVGYTGYGGGNTVIVTPSGYGGIPGTTYPSQRVVRPVANPAVVPNYGNPVVIQNGTSSVVPGVPATTYYAPQPVNNGGYYINSNGYVVPITTQQTQVITPGGGVTIYEERTGW